MPDDRQAPAVDARPLPTVDGGDVVAAIAAIDPKGAVSREDRTERRQAVAEVKARALAEVGGFSVTVNRRKHTVSGVRYDPARNAVVCEVSGLPDGANPLVFMNPPVMVGDGTFTEDAAGRVENVREDPAEAFRAIVAQTIAHLS